MTPETTDPRLECAYGHRQRKVGCVSCVLVFDRAIPGLPIGVQVETTGPRIAELIARLRRDAANYDGRVKAEQRLEAAEATIARLREVAKKWAAMAKADAKGGVAQALKRDREYFGRVNAAFAYDTAAKELDAALDPLHSPPVSAPEEDKP